MPQPPALPVPCHLNEADPTSPYPHPPWCQATEVATWPPPGQSAHGPELKIPDRKTPGAGEMGMWPKQDLSHSCLNRTYGKFYVHSQIQQWTLELLVTIFPQCREHKTTQSSRTNGGLKNKTRVLIMPLGILDQTVPEGKLSFGLSSYMNQYISWWVLFKAI